MLVVDALEVTSFVVSAVFFPDCFFGEADEISAGGRLDMDVGTAGDPFGSGWLTEPTGAADTTMSDLSFGDSSTAATDVEALSVFSVDDEEVSVVCRPEAGIGSVVVCFGSAGVIVRTLSAVDFCVSPAPATGDGLTSDNAGRASGATDASDLTSVATGDFCPACFFDDADWMFVSGGFGFDAEPASFGSG